MITTRSELRRLVERLGAAPWLAIDIEGDGFFRYRPRLCTLQLCAGASIEVVDTLAVLDGDLLQALLGPEGPPKVLHDLSFDARLLRAHGVELGNVYDTAVAARFLGEPATGLASLLAARCDVHLSKQQQQADWGVRPFSEQALSYLAADVQHLHELAESLRTDVAAAGIEAEVQEETAYVLRQALLPPAPAGPPWLRMKGARKLAPATQAVLRELAALREELAEDKDVPPFRIAHDRVLIGLAQRPPQARARLTGIKALTRSLLGRDLGRVWEAVEAGRAAGAPPPDELNVPSEEVPPPAERALRKAREQALLQWRRGTAEERGCDLQVVLPGHCLKALVRMNPRSPAELASVDGFGSFRVERYGSTLLALLAEAEPPERAGAEGSG